jgi:glycosyltransferase involved in cell wall biosynthesis
VPHNRWDLLDGRRRADPIVSVVVVHYDQPDQLARTLAALARQTLLPTEIVIADDGSAVTPSVPAGGPPTRVVSQPDLGFRAGAARNRAARECRGEILVFLDADTSPEPEFLRSLTRRLAQCRDVVAVGRRRHADLTGLPLDADPAGAPELDEPAWLRDGYASTRDLLDADGRSFRYVISAVLACGRPLYEELGGFDERFVDYGGEDWDFAYRAWNAGAVLVHEPGAVAWHDGPGWAGRAGPADTHDLQSMRLATLIPEPSTRGAPIPYALPDVLVEISPDPSGGVGAVVRCVHSVLRQRFRDLAVRLDPPVERAVAQMYGAALRTDPWDRDQLARARARLAVRRPLPPHALDAAMAMLVDGDLGSVELVAAGAGVATLTATRAAARASRWRDRLSYGEVTEGLFGTGHLEVGPVGAGPEDLAGFFARDWSE